ncbi:hypothetical protein JCM6882_008102 [Rhodosporidiobolus microsporus]
MALAMLDMTFLERFRGGNHVPDVSLAGRTILVTGANAGLGLEAAIHFARLSPGLLILAVRTPSTGEAAADRIAKETSLARDRIQVWQLDLSSFANVKAFGEKARKELDRLDVACLNAGVAGFKREMTPEGHERMIQVNVISTGLLAVELLPVLLRTADLPAPPGADPHKPHLSIVSSDVHYVAGFNERKAVPSKHSSYLAALDDESIFVGSDRYNVSKLLDVMMAREFAKLPALKAKGVVVNSVNPGLTKSALRRDAPGVVECVLNVIARPTADSAMNYAYAGIADTDGQEHSKEGGAFISRCQVIAPSKFMLSEEGKEVSRKIWEELIEVWRGIDGAVVREVIG